MTRMANGPLLPAGHFRMAACALRTLPVFFCSGPAADRWAFGSISI